MPADRELREDLHRRHRAAAELVRHTPMLSLRSLSDRFGAPVLVKAECLQRTGSFKLRGALSKLDTLGPGSRGLTAGSAGNHGQAVAYAARARGLPCTVFMPQTASVSKVRAVRGFGARVELDGDSVDECVNRAREHARDEGLDFVHPFDDEEVVRGQAGLGLELLQDAAELAQVVVPIGGGGLAAGISLALEHRPEVRVVGVQASACAPLVAWPQVAPIVRTVASVADGIAIKQPGGVPLKILERRLDDLVTVDEQAIMDAIAFLLERAKLVVEGAGAVGVAALQSGRVSPPRVGSTAVILSGGNIDTSVLAHVLSRYEARSGRRARAVVSIPDRPGALAELLAGVARSGANVLDVRHVRDEMTVAPGETSVELLMETRGNEHRETVLASLPHGSHPAASELPD